MTRAAMICAVLFASLAFATEGAAKTSIASLNASELPCPGNVVEPGNSAALDPSLLTVPAVAPAPAKVTTRNSRNRWKVLLPGSLKSPS